VKLLAALATLTSAFLRNHRLAEQAREADARRRDGELARQIHRSLLPSCEADCSAVETAGVSQSTEKIGGDCYDYLAFADGSLGILIADVSGHGVAAAMYMAAARGALHAEARRSSDPAAILRRANAALSVMFDPAGMYATAFFVCVSADGREWSYSGAGHPPALCLRGDGLADRLESQSTALGLFEDTDFETRHFTLTPDDRLVLYTDGFTEARSSTGELYGIDRLTRVALEGRHKNVASLRQHLLADLEAHTEHRGVADDVTLVLAQPCRGPA
jgi:sigma-B regulation protein RsbU (phosphoserine phosphatase)